MINVLKKEYRHIFRNNCVFLDGLASFFNAGFLLFFVFKPVFSYPIVELPENIFDEPSCLIDNTTRQLTLNSFLDNMIDQKSNVNEIVLKRNQSDIIFQTPFKTGFHTAAVAFGLKAQDIDFKSAGTVDSSLALYSSKFNKYQLMYGKRLGSKYGAGASAGIIEGTGKIDYVLEGIIDINEKNRCSINYSNINLCSGFKFVYKNEEMEIPVEQNYSNLRFNVPLALSENCSLLLKVKLTDFNSGDKTSEGFLLDYSGGINSLEMQSGYRINQNNKLLVELGQELAGSGIRLLSGNIEFGRLPLDLFYYSLGVGAERASVNGKYFFTPKLISHSFNVAINGYIESWPFTSIYTEIFGAGQVYNFSCKAGLDLYELQLNLRRLSGRTASLEILNSVFYVNANDWTAGIWKRNSSIIGFMGPGEYTPVSVPEEIKDSYYDKLTVKYTREFRNVQLSCSYGLFFPIRAGREDKGISQIVRTPLKIGQEEVVGQTEIPGIFNLSMKIIF